MTTRFSQLHRHWSRLVSLLQLRLAVNPNQPEPKLQQEEAVVAAIIAELMLRNETGLADDLRQMVSRFRQTPDAALVDAVRNRIAALS